MAILRRSNLAASMALLVAAMLAAVIIPAPGALAATCQGGSCHNKGPEGTGCADTTIQNLSDITPDVGGPTIRLVIRYSATCKAAWSRGTKTDSGPGYGLGALIGIQWGTQDAAGAFTVKGSLRRLVFWGSGSGESDWTNMVSLIPSNQRPRQAARSWYCVYDSHEMDHCPTVYGPWRTAPL